MFKKIAILWICILFLLVSSVSAVPPVSVIFSGDTGLQIEASPPRYLQQNSIGEITAHVFNTTNGVLMTNETPGLVGCKSLIQWPNGTTLAQVDATPIGDYFFFSLDLTNVSRLGEYGWVIHCNNSDQGGYIKGSFELTTSGNEEATIPVVLSFLGVILIIMLFLCLSIYGIVVSESALGKYISVVLTYFFFVVFTYISWIMADRFIVISSFAVWFLKFLFMFSLWSFLPFFFLSLTFLLYQMYKIKEIKGLIERGIPEDEAYKRVKKK